MARSKMAKIALFVLPVLSFLAFLHLLNSGGRFSDNRQSGSSDVRYERAKIIRVISEFLEKEEKAKGGYRGIQHLQVQILTGEHRGETHRIRNYLSNLYQVHAKAGMDIIVCVDTAGPGNYLVSVYNYHRAPVLYGLILFFLGVLGWVGGKKGLQSIAGLGFTLICIAFLFIPMLYRGYSPIFASVLVVFLAAVVTLFAINGWSAKTVSAILGTTGGVIIAGIVSGMFGRWAHLSGFNAEEAESLIVIASHTGMKVGELLFAGILIASLGAVMDVAMSIASSIYEVYETNPALTPNELFTSGLHVGRDMLGTMANTLILAFTGSSINSLILIYAYNVKYGQLINMDRIGIEIIQGMAGSIAIIFTVPIISWIASQLIVHSHWQSGNPVKPPHDETTKPVTDANLPDPGNPYCIERFSVPGSGSGPTRSE
jgi:uncharacterized membrane protein